VNFANPDKGKVASNIIVSLNYKLKAILETWGVEEMEE
jgi:hypothetical protein